MQLDYQHDPSTKQDQKYWAEFFERFDAVEDQIAQWEAVAAPNAGDLAQKEKRLSELRQQLARMEAQVRLSRGDYYPERKRADGEGEATSTLLGVPVQYVPYPKVMHQLAERLGATPEELAAWVHAGPKDGGIAAYLNANELDPPPRFYYATGTDSHDYVAPLMACWFRAHDVDHFVPADRYITGKALIERWGDKPGLHAVAFIHAKIAESRLLDIHPIYGGTRGTFSENTDFPPLESGLFVLSQVEQIEAEDFAVVVEGGEATTTHVQQTAVNSKGSPLGPCAVFLAMENLVASELSLAFVGDKAESGLGANNMLEISARGTTKRVALAALDLVDSRRGTLNSQCAILLLMAHKQKFPRSDKNAKKMTRLREVFRRHLGVISDPFEPYRTGKGWAPHFKISDNRGLADERAKQNAERLTVSYDQLTESGAQFETPDQGDQGFDDEDDDAGKWLKNRDGKAQR